ncbi:hypothetical protein [Photobacterium aquimaris]|uniref:Uncharacterized protein n=1 Tax=Photobacterium aquimaris TaxID=512643 RepID=A0A1Y6L1Z5_9GAMM|nr:hypothetical protein [Photobacterium aquimaris]SMY18460.1 hypothetical protein PAQU9191_03821 [Photobacterium aquimaris]
MFYITIINSLFIYFSLTFIDVKPYITIFLSIIPFIVNLDIIMLLDKIFIKLPIKITYYYINISHNKSFIFNIEKHINHTFTKIIIAIIFSLRSFEAKDIFTKITLVSTLILLFTIDYKQTSYAPPILQSIIAAIIFDFIIIKIPQELKRQSSINAIKKTLNVILNGHMALRYLTIKDNIKDIGISVENLRSCLNSFENTNFNEKLTTSLHVSNSIKYLNLRNTKSKPISKNDEIVIILKEILENTEKLLNSSELNEFQDLKTYILNIGNIGIYSEKIKDYVSNNNNVNLELNNKEIAKSFIEGYLIPLEGMCYWYKRKARRYIRNDYRSLVNFDLNSTKLFYTYNTDRAYIQHF